MTHTHEPWTTEEWSDGTLSIEGKRLTIANLFGNFEEDAEVYPNARRIVAAVNACAGQHLGEGADVRRLVETAKDFIRSVSAPIEPSNLAKSPAAAYVFAKELEAALAPFVESE